MHSTASLSVGVAAGFQIQPERWVSALTHTAARYGDSRNDNELHFVPHGVRVRILRQTSPPSPLS